MMHNFFTVDCVFFENVWKALFQLYKVQYRKITILCGVKGQY